MATLSVIRRWALREHLSIREIARRTGLSRNTIRKYLRSDVVQPQPAQRTIATKLDPFASKLSGWLRTEANRSRKQRRTIKQMFRSATAATGHLRSVVCVRFRHGKFSLAVFYWRDPCAWGCTGSTSCQRLLDEMV